MGYRKPYFTRTNSWGNNTASASWDSGSPQANTGDLIICHLMWDDSTNTTSVTAPSGPNGETITSLFGGTPYTDSGTNVRCEVFYTQATGPWPAASSGLVFTPNASEQWMSFWCVVPAGFFDTTTPISATYRTDSSGTAQTSGTGSGFTLGSADGGGSLVLFTTQDTESIGNFQTSGWTYAFTRDIGAVAGSIWIRNAPTAHSESTSSVTFGLNAAEQWLAVQYVIRPPSSPTLFNSGNKAYLSDTSIALIGRGFGASQGAGTVYLCSNEEVSWGAGARHYSSGTKNYAGAQWEFSIGIPSGWSRVGILCVSLECTGYPTTEPIGRLDGHRLIFLGAKQSPDSGGTRVYMAVFLATEYMLANAPEGHFRVDISTGAGKANRSVTYVQYNHAAFAGFNIAPSTSDSATATCSITSNGTPTVLAGFLVSNSTTLDSLGGNLDTSLFSTTSGGGVLAVMADGAISGSGSKSATFNLNSAQNWVTAAVLISFSTYPVTSYVDIGTAISAWSDTSITLNLSNLTPSTLETLFSNTEASLARVAYPYLHAVVKTNGGTQFSCPAKVLRGKAFSLAASGNISASGANTTAQLTAPLFRTGGDFGGGRIQDDENPGDAVDVAANQYREDEWSIQSSSKYAFLDRQYYFRVLFGGNILQKYSATPILSFAAQYSRQLVKRLANLIR